MSKTSLSFSTFKCPRHFLFSVSVLCLSHSILKGSEIISPEDRLQANRPRLGRARNTPSIILPAVHKEPSRQHEAEFQQGLKRLHQKIIQTTAAEFDVYFQAKQALHQFYNVSIERDENFERTKESAALKSAIDHLMPPEALINIDPKWREELIEPPLLMPDNPGFGVIHERIKELDTIGLILNKSNQEKYLSDLKAAQIGYQTFIQALCQFETTQTQQRKAHLAPRIAMTGEGLGRYLIPESLAQKMLSKDQHGLSQKALNKQEGGNNNVYAQGGVHFKSTGSVETIKPDQEWATHAFSMLLFGSSYTPPSITLCLHQIPFRQFRENMGQLSNEEKQWRNKFSNEVTIPNGNPATYNALASELFFQRNPLARQYCHMVGQDTYLQASESSGEISLGDFLEQVKTGQQSFDHLDHESYSGMAIISYLLRFADAKDDNYRVMLNSQGKGHRLISIDNEDIFANEIVYHKETGKESKNASTPTLDQDLEHDYIVQTKDVLFLIPELMNKPLAPLIIKRLNEVNAHSSVLQWLSECQQQNVRYQQAYAHLKISKESAPQHIHFGSNIALRLVQELQQVQTVVKKYPQTSFGQLFERTRPLSAAFYQALRDQSAHDLRGAQNTLWGNKQATSQLTLNQVVRTPELRKDLSKITAQAADYQHRNIYGRCAPPETPEQQARRFITDIDFSATIASLPPATLKGLLDGLQHSFPKLFDQATNPYQDTGLKTSSATADLSPQDQVSSSWLSHEGLLSQAVKAGCRDTVLQRLIQAHPSLHYQHPETQRTVFHEAAAHNIDPRLMKMLISYLNAEEKDHLLNRPDYRMLTPLDEAMTFSPQEALNVSVLIEAGAIDCNDQIALKFYHRFAQLPADKKTPTQHSALQQLLRVNPLINWQITLAELIPTESQRKYQTGDLILESPAYGRHFVSKTIVDQLMTPQRDGWRSANQSGNHQVAYAQATGQITKHGLYFKVFPALPGIEEAASSLIRLFTPHGAPYSEIVKVQDQAVLISQEIPGPTLLEVLKKDPAQLKTLDPNETARLILAAMLINPEDGKPDNYILTPHPINKQSTHIISIDNDQAFVPAMVREKPDVGVITKKLRPVVQVKTILYCLDAMKQVIPEPVRTQVMAMNPDRLMETWLNKLHRAQQRQSQVFSSQEREIYFRDSNSFVGIPFQKGAIKHLYEKWDQLRDLVTTRPEITLIDLLAKLEPRLASRYQKALDQNISPLARFEQVDRPFYTVKSSGSYSTQTQSHDILQSMNIPMHMSLTELAQANYLLAPQQALVELNQIKATLAQQNQQLLTADFKNPQVIQALGLEATRTAFLERLARSHQVLTSQQQNDLLNLLVQEKDIRNLILPNFASLTPKHLEQLSLTHLRKLDVRGCFQFNNKSLTLLARSAPALDHLNLANSPQFKKIKIDDILGSPLTFEAFTNIPKFTKIKADDILGSPLVFEALEYLNLANNLNLTQIKIRAPQLKWLDVSDNPKLTDEGLDHLTKYSPNLTTLRLTNTPLIHDSKMRMNYLNHYYSIMASIMAMPNINHQSLLVNLFKSDETTQVLSRQNIDNIFARILAMNIMLTSLDLSHNQIGDAGAGALAVNRSLMNLNLDSNKIGDAGARALAANTTLTSLKLRSNKISDAGAEALAANTMFRSLDLGKNQIGDTSAQTLATNTTLTSLNLGSNEISDAGARALAANTTLKSLDLSFNHIGAAGAQALAANTTLTSLNLERSTIGYSSTNVCGVAFGANNILKILNLSHTYIGDADAQALAANTTLTSLNLLYNEIGDAGAQALAANTTLRELDLSANEIGDAAKATLRQNTHLLKLKL